MKYAKFLLALIATIGIISLFNNNNVLPLAFGKFLAPHSGFWQNAEPEHPNLNGSISLSELKDSVSVSFDDRLVPHIYAKNDLDAYTVQGYLHAKFRLWQMELQAFAALGRASEVVGEIALNNDRKMRRLGMVYGAKNTLKTMESDSITKAVCDAYTKGINAYIEQLSQKNLPIEYKMLNYKPEKWSNLKTAALAKYMSYMLSARSEDFEQTLSREYFSKEDYNLLFPAKQDSLDPIIPKGTAYVPPSYKPVAPKSVQTSPLYSFNEPETDKPHKNNGSNNWAVSGSKTQSGNPILANDPHLSLNLPSIWYELQITTPTSNSYGVSFPGAPFVIIGFNQTCAFGFTNGGRDVMDYYDVKFKDNSKQEYWFDSSWKKATVEVETYKIKGKKTLYDTMSYTIFGPIMYDNSYAKAGADSLHYYAVKWKGQDGSNDLKMFWYLNRATNYDDYLQAMHYLESPGQNGVFATHGGDIALRTQGSWPAKWAHQGEFIMPGTDSSYLWQKIIPFDETPNQHNPARGFVSSANQRPADYNYPYYLGNDYPLSRGKIINQILNKASKVSPTDMTTLQQNSFDYYGSVLLPLCKKYIQKNTLPSNKQVWVDTLLSWNYINEAYLRAPSIYHIFEKKLYNEVFDDEYSKVPKNSLKPEFNTLVEYLLKDSVLKFYENINTPQHEKLKDVFTSAFSKSIDSLQSITANTQDWVWYKVRNTRIKHLLQLDAFSTNTLVSDGAGNSINALYNNHGPSWRMVVQLANTPEAYVVYPGGQSGNPGSYYYDNFVNTWASGNYYKPLFINGASSTSNASFLGTITFAHK